LLESILGADLKDKIYAQRTGLRQRLTHGEYLNAGDTSEDYVRVIHGKIIAYFNGLIGSDVISTGTVDPQRHPHGNKMVGRFFLRPKESATPLRLREVVADFEANNHHAEKYDYVHDDSLTKNY
jgi:hypothetical protein